MGSCGQPITLAAELATMIVGSSVPAGAGDTRVDFVRNFAGNQPSTSSLWKAAVGSVGSFQGQNLVLQGKLLLTFCNIYPS